MQAAQQIVHSLGQPPLLAPAALLHLVEPALLGLRPPEALAALQPVEQLGVDRTAVAHRAPEQSQFVVSFPDFRTDMGDERAGVDAGIYPVQRAAHLLGLSVVKRPERAI